MDGSRMMRTMQMRGGVEESFANRNLGMVVEEENWARGSEE